jgi:hypothetical protein
MASLHLRLLRAMLSLPLPPLLLAVAAACAAASVAMNPVPHVVHPLHILYTTTTVQLCCITRSTHPPSSGLIRHHGVQQTCSGMVDITSFDVTCEGLYFEPQRRVDGYRSDLLVHGWNGVHESLLSVYQRA